MPARTETRHMLVDPISAPRRPSAAELDDFHKLWEALEAPVEKTDGSGSVLQEANAFQQIDTAVSPLIQESRGKAKLRSMFGWVPGVSRVKTAVVADTDLAVVVADAVDMTRDLPQVRVKGTVVPANGVVFTDHKGYVSFGSNRKDPDNPQGGEFGLFSDSRGTTVITTDTRQIEVFQRSHETRITVSDMQGETPVPVGTVINKSSLLLI